MEVKRFLDKEGLKHFARVLSNYPDNTILAAVIDAISESISETSIEDKKYTDDKVVEILNTFAVSNVYVGGGDMPEGYNLQIDPNDNEVQFVTEVLKEYIDSLNLNPKFNVTINVTTYNDEPVSDVYVYIYEHDSRLLYTKVMYNGQPITVELPENFKYNIVVDELPGNYIESQSGIIIQDTELSFKYMQGKIYGVTWDKSATTVLSRTDAAALFEDPKPYIAGATQYGSPFDTCMPWAGMTITQNDNAGSLVAIPKYWYRWTNNDYGNLSLQIADFPAEGFSVSPAHRDRGDGKGERDVVYVGRYHCSSSNWKSVTGASPKVNVTRATCRSSIKALGSGIYQNDYALFWTIRMLYLVEFADWNSQKVIGYGRGNGSGVQTMGYTDTMPYHTGTMLSGRNTYGVGTQYRNIEGIWDNVLDWCDGVYFSGANVYAHFNPNDYNDSANGTLVCTRPTAGGYIVGWKFSDNSQFADWFMYPSEVGGTEITYVADYCVYSSGGTVLCVGGNYSQHQDCGMFCLTGGNGASVTYGYVGSRLMVLP